MGRADRADRDRSWPDLPPVRADPGKAVLPHSTTSSRPGQERIRPRPCAWACCTCRVRTGSGRHRRRRRHRHHRAGDHRADAVVRGRCGPAAAVLRPGRPARRRAGRRVPASSASDPGDRRRRDARVGGRVGVQCARRTAARHPRLHRRAAGTGSVASDEIARSSTSAVWSTTRTRNCRTAPTVPRAGKLRHRTGHQGHHRWLNTPNGAPVDLKSLRGKVVLIDFWAYSCINCQRAIPTSSTGRQLPRSRASR